MSSPSTVVFVKEGTWGGVAQEDASQGVELLAEVLRRTTREDSDTHQQVPVAKVEVFETLAEARERVGQGGVDVLVLNSRSNLREARVLKNTLGRKPRIVIVSGGAIDDEEVVIVDRSWLDGDTIAKILIR